LSLVLAGCMQTSERTTASIISIDHNLTYDQALRKNMSKAMRESRENPEDPAPHYMLGRGYLIENKLEDAQKEFELIIELSPGSAGAHYELGMIYARRGQCEKAIESMKTSVKLKPDYSEAHYTLARLYEKIGDYEKAAMHNEAYHDSKSQ